VSLMATVMNQYPDPAPVEEPRARKLHKAFHVESINPDQIKFLREDEERLVAERKRLRTILEEWEPNLVATKARKNFETQLEQIRLNLRQLRARMGK
jgi:hypothetical protein